MIRRLAIVCALLAAPLPALATGFSDVEAPPSKEGVNVLLDGYFRLRGEGLYDLDLDRGPTPSGQVLFPTPLSDPTSHFLYGGDMRLRTDLTLVAPGGGFDVKIRADLLDNVALGNAPVGVPAVAGAYQPTIINIKRAYGEAYTPIGVLAAGRMGSQWGLGMLANGGDCADCDYETAADRIAFMSPMLGHIWALAYDFTAVGVESQRKDGVRPLDIEPSAQVHSVTFAFLRWRNERSTERRLRAGKTTIDYGSYLSYRWQTNDVPASYLPVAVPVTINGAQVVPRNFSATAIDGWLRIEHPFFHIELEAAGLFGQVDQSSLIPGVLIRGNVTSKQYGAAMESEFGGRSAFRAGFDAGVASGDTSPGFGAFTPPGASAGQPGDVSGSQVSPPNHMTANNFQFSPDYHVDRILFRELIGTVTDAFYLRPHLRWTALEVGPGSLTLSLAGILSYAMEPSSTPSGTRPLGLELDPTITWAHKDGFSAVLEYAVLFPFSAFDNPALGLRAQPAQLARLRLTYAF